MLVKTRCEMQQMFIVAEQYQEEQLFVATCFASKSTSKSWVVDSGCTNHMTNDQGLFREFDKIIYLRIYSSKRQRNNSHIKPNMFKNSFFYLVEKGFKVSFENKFCLIRYAEGREVFNINIKGKSFALNIVEDEQVVVSQQESDTVL
ncbi:LRR receptor-like serine/threonine-protein kinase FLS2 [Gossypium australe]|uniref:LRR receptor-like serine/threonine-protein kinase FLS2 n=1 Tax=Gossypium australe TaxID=47621 RepID=A0A5B6VSY8_9ROSI|nr:LRR receptor-like serine/threonine-protein kinase FLS2 [Gossypium australe]